MYNNEKDCWLEHGCDKYKFSLCITIQIKNSHTENSSHLPIDIHTHYTIEKWLAYNFDNYYLHIPLGATPYTFGGYCI